MFHVIATVRTQTTEPVEVHYYSGESRAAAIAGLATAAQMDLADTDMPADMQTFLVSVRMDFDAPSE